MIIIKGDNGSGKSTLFKALTPIQDSNESFIPGKIANKTISYTDGVYIYKITYIHDVKPDGSRASAKGYIKKICNGIETELNPNGNITECKDLIYQLFNLDANFVSLSQLSSEDRGLADKKPADRKKFVNSIIDKIEVYNNIYKSLSKRSTLFKSMINSITSKIDSLGNKESIILSLASLEDRIAKLTRDKEVAFAQLAIANDIIEKLDKDGNLSSRYGELRKQSTELVSSISDINGAISNLMQTITDKEPTRENFTELFIRFNNYSERLKSDIENLKKESSTLLANRELEVTKINEKNARLKSLSDDKNYITIKTMIKEYSKELEAIETLFKTSGMSNYANITKDEYTLIHNTLDSIKNSIDIIRSEYDSDILNDSIKRILGNKNPTDIDYLDRAILEKKDMLSKYRDQYTLLYSDKKIADKFSMIPNGCKLKEKCDLAKDIVNAYNSGVDDKLNKLYLDIQDAEYSIKNFEESKTYYINSNRCMNDIKNIIRQLDAIKSVVAKFNLSEIYGSRDSFLYNLANGYIFYEIEKFNEWLDCSNLLEQYKLLKDTIQNLKSEEIKYKSRDELIEEIMKDIEYLDSNIKKIYSSMEKNQLEISVKQNEYNKSLDYLKKTKYILDSIVRKEERESLLQNCNSQIQSIESDAQKLYGAKKDCDTFRNAINVIVQEINPLLEERDKLKHHIRLIDEYKVELEEYNTKYDKVETIKYYSSPTTGIQIIFMEIYMNKIINMANQLLGLLFNGEYVLYPFIINESEFRIPCCGKGLMNDDISSMSTSQICMISMILSFALLFHSSTKYNIIKLDEIDGGLDSVNRSQFLNLLNQLMDILECEQCIMISHNSELNLSNADIIVLKNSDHSLQLTGNVIYKY